MFFDWPLSSAVPPTSAKDFTRNITGGDKGVVIAHYVVVVFLFCHE